MTNGLALVLGGLILAIFAADLLFFHWGMSLFLAKKFSEFSEFIAFWR
ncbi:hypothetical protein [Pseudoruegeria sp. SHC-113]|nr:hypothetical protein [Pseudoruegeria sp. SHC-113]MCT8160621.1 hypothetical protein [Pseudoruegeria sp. SHC-113]